MVNNNLSEVRKDKGLTQEELAEKSGISRDGNYTFEFINGK